MTDLSHKLATLASHLDAALAFGAYWQLPEVQPHLKAAIDLKCELLSRSDAETPRWVKFALGGCEGYSQYEQVESLTAHAKLVRVLVEHIVREAG